MFCPGVTAAGASNGPRQMRKTKNWCVKGTILELSSSGRCPARPASSRLVFGLSILRQIHHYDGSGDHCRVIRWRLLCKQSYALRNRRRCEGLWEGLCRLAGVERRSRHVSRTKALNHAEIYGRLAGESLPWLYWSSTVAEDLEHKYVLYGTTTIHSVQRHTSSTDQRQPTLSIRLTIAIVRDNDLAMREEVLLASDRKQGR